MSFYLLLIFVQNFDAQKLELDRIRYTLTIEQRRVGEIEIQLEEKENMCILLLEEKNILKSQLGQNKSRI